MQLKEFDIILRMKDPVSIAEHVEVVQGDSNSNAFNITMVDGLAPYDLSGANVEIIFRKSDKTTVQQTQPDGIGILDAKQGKLICILKTNSIASPGIVLAEVRISEGDTLLTSALFKFRVRASLMNDETIESTNEFPILTQLITTTEDLIEKVEGIEEQVPENVIERIDLMEDSKLDKVGMSGNTTVEFEEEEGNLINGSKLSVLFGNIKYFLKGVITVGKLANNGVTTEAGLALDARYGANLQDQVTTLNNNLALKQPVYSIYKGISITAAGTTTIPLLQYVAGSISIAFRGSINGSYLYHFHNWASFASKIVSEIISSSGGAPTLEWDSVDRNLIITHKNMSDGAFMDVIIVPFTLDRLP